MHAIVRAAQVGNWQEKFGARVALVVSNRADAAGLDIARQLGLPTEVVDHTAYPNRDAFEQALGAAIDAHSAPALVALAGFMRILTSDFVNRYQVRLLNIHPSLLPAFPGLNTHQRALNAGCKVAGATVHHVTAQLDHGPILAQASVPILESDDAATLAARVRVQEHVIYPAAIESVLAHMSKN